MPRVFKEEEYTSRRNEILNSARRLVNTKGYEQMTIQDILEDLQISKGAFYHYFDSKGEVLQALVERIVIDEVEPLLIPIVQDPDLTALEKLHCYFDTAARWKYTRKSLMLELLRVWVADTNAIVRQKMFSMTVKRVTPLLTEIIRQGIDEGVFKTAYPEQVCHVIIYILQGLSDTFVDLLIAGESDRDDKGVESALSAYSAALSDAMERVLGAPKGSLNLIDPDTLKAWFSNEETEMVDTSEEYNG
jgi:AcrR family transcriptional regulator